jgi:hypothetical protein
VKEPKATRLRPKEGILESPPPPSPSKGHIHFGETKQKICRILLTVESLKKLWLI